MSRVNLLSISLSLHPCNIYYNTPQQLILNISQAYKIAISFNIYSNLLGPVTYVKLTKKVSKLQLAKLCDAVCGHVCKMCKYYKNLTII